MEKQILEILTKDSQSPKEFETLLEELASNRKEFAYLLEKFRMEKKKILVKSWEGWFQLLGWWFAKLLMYGALVVSIALAVIFGRDAVDQITFGLIGAAFYYVLIQVLTPYRIRRETEALKLNDVEKCLKDLLE
ncbi:MAG: hypothetical protein Kow0029_24360 [Candidatus Rifleibacteriota bacterium]